MTFVVPFDGSQLSEAALVRAAEFGAGLEEDVLAVSVIPARNAGYARERGWLGSDDPFVMEDVVATLHEHVTDIYPSADFRHVVVDEHAAAGTIGNRVRRVAREEDASMVFVGSENAGRLVTALSSVGGSVAADDAYDVVIVRHRRPAAIDALRDHSPRHPKSDFFLSG